MKAAAIILLVIIAIIFILVMIAGIRKIRGENYSFIFKMALGLVKQAEHMFGGGTGELKYAYVVNKLMSALPASAMQFIKPKDIDRAIENALTAMKKKLEEAEQKAKQKEQSKVEGSVDEK